MRRSATNPNPTGSTPGLAALAARVSELNSLCLLLASKLKRAGVTGDIDLAARFEDLARTVAEVLEASTPKGPPAPRWVGIDDQTYREQVEALAAWVNEVLVSQYTGYELRPCWAEHIHVVWELSTLAAEWSRTYVPAKPDLDRALAFYDRYLPNTMRRVADYTRKCAIQHTPGYAARTVAW